MGKKLIFSCLLFACLSFVVADSLFGFSQKGGTVETLPDYCGMREDDIAPPEWLSLQTEYRYDDSVSAGTVISQSPAGGTQRKVSGRRECNMTLTVSLGAERKEVPAVSGMDIREASALLRQHGFSVCEEPVSGGVEGNVQRTDPPAGSSLRAGEIVTVYVYAGENAETVTVPNFVGLSRGSALLQIYLNGLTAGEVTEEASTAPDGTVIRHSPAAGSLVRPGTKVRLVISKQIFTQDSGDETIPEN